MSIKIALGGGGDPPDSVNIDNWFVSNMLGPKLLYVVEAAVPEIWSKKDAVEWLRKSKAYSNLEITVLADLAEIDEDTLLGFDGLYLLGGNTFKLWNKIRSAGFAGKLNTFLNASKPCFGLSAGAIILGADIRTACVGEQRDEDQYHTSQYTALNLLAGLAVHTHSTNNDRKALELLSMHIRRRIVCIPENSGIAIDGDSWVVKGNAPIEIVSDSTIDTVHPEHSIDHHKHESYQST